jgi:hypothetical protein
MEWPSGSIGSHGTFRELGGYFIMRIIFATAVLMLAAAPAMAATQIQCAQIPQAQSFVDGLKAGPNTKAAQLHLDAAKKAKSDTECVNELGKVNYYAKRSANADKRAAARAAAKPATVQTAIVNKTPVKTVKTKRPRTVQCADLLHQNRPGGTDYKGPPVPSCNRPS